MLHMTQKWEVTEIAHKYEVSVSWSACSIAIKTSITRKRDSIGETFGIFLNVLNIFGNGMPKLATGNSLPRAGLRRGDGREQNEWASCEALLNFENDTSKIHPTVGITKLSHKFTIKTVKLTLWHYSSTGGGGVGVLEEGWGVGDRDGVLSLK